MLNVFFNSNLSNLKRKNSIDQIFILNHNKEIAFIEHNCKNLIFVDENLLEKRAINFGSLLILSVLFYKKSEHLNFLIILSSDRCIHFYDYNNFDMSFVLNINENQNYLVHDEE